MFMKEKYIKKNENEMNEHQYSIHDIFVRKMFNLYMYFASKCTYLIEANHKNKIKIRIS